MGAICTYSYYGQFMTRVIQIRDVPDDVHDALRAAADARGLSLTKFVLVELEALARRDRRVQENLAAVRGTQARVGVAVDRDLILAEVRAGRGE